jgi:hypothetical protein
VLRESIIIPGLCRRIEAHDRCSGEIQPSDVLIIDTVPATMAWRRFARYRAHSLSRSRCVTPSCTSREACIWSAVPDVVRAGIGLSLRVACNALGCARPRRPALFTERRVGALCTQTRRFQAVRTSYVSPCRNTVSSKFEVLGPRNGRGPTSSNPLKVQVVFSGCRV